MTTTYVHYFIPYDGDVEEHPNIFVVRKPLTAVTLGDIQQDVQAFPLPGTYFFRAKQPYGKTHVWLDLHSVGDVTPAFNGKIILKVSRLSNSGAPAGSPASVTTSVQSPTPSVASSSHRPQESATRVPKQPAAVPTTTTSTAAKAPDTADMLGLFDAPSSSPPVPSASPTSSSVPADIFASGPSGSPTGAATMPPMAGRGAGFDAFSSVGWSAPAPSAGRGVAPRPGPARGPIGGGPAPQAQAPKASTNLLDGDIFNM